jgi:hypothetical protein
MPSLGGHGRYQGNVGDVKYLEHSDDQYVQTRMQDEYKDRPGTLEKTPLFRASRTQEYGCYGSLLSLKSHGPLESLLLELETARAIGPRQILDERPTIAS